MKINKRIIPVITALAILSICIYVLSQLYEIYTVPWYRSPSLEAMENEYLALERWLNGNNIEIKTEYEGNASIIMENESQSVFLHSFVYDWTDENINFLIDWIAEGGHLFLSLDSNNSQDYLPLLEEFGIIPAADFWRASDFQTRPFYPDYDYRFTFSYREDDHSHTDFADYNGNIRLVQTDYGKGRFIIAGGARFLYNEYLQNAPNAILGWGIFGGREEWLFIRENPVSFFSQPRPGLFIKIMEEGNSHLLLISAAVLLIVGFWCVIPGFGILKGEIKTRGKPIGERFLSEGHFLFRHKSLSYYRDFYLREIKRLLVFKEGISNPEDAENRLREITGEYGDHMEGKDPSSKEFTEMIIKLKNILESI